MTELLTVVGLVTVVVAVSALARRVGLLAPIMLLLAGTALSFLPGVPQIHLDPDIVLNWILPPLLYVAAVNTSVPAFRFNLRPILLLAIGLVLVTAFAVGFAVHLILPAVPFAATLALGAVVAPPDAVSATAIARRIGLPRRTVAILEGESLVNDATALALFSVAIGAATGRSVSAGSIALSALLISVGGVAVGVLGGFVVGAVHRRVSDPLLDNAVSLIAPFVVYATAAAIHASSVVAVVVTGLSLGHRYPVLMSAASRLQMEAFWRMVNFVLEGAVFVLVGLQLRLVVDQLHTGVPMVARATVVVVGTVIAIRFVWMYPATYLARLMPGVRGRDAAPPLRVPTVLAWAGMRGVVTLATALALPATLAHGAGYPRDLFVFLASMSYYLIKQIEDVPNISVRTCTEVIEAIGEDHLQSLRLRNTATGDTETVDAQLLFLFIGAAPLTDWLDGVVVRDSRGFVVAGPDLSVGGERPGGWELDRMPYHLETSIPGVFVAGDARAESAKRVASAVGEGALAVMLVHRYLEKR